MSYPITVSLIPGLPENPYRNGVYEGSLGHSTATPNATAAAERNYESGHWQDAFVHFFVDWTSIIQVAKIEFSCWGAGHTANQRYVQVELCETADPNLFNESYARYVWLHAKLLFDRKLGVKHGSTFFTHADTSALFKETNHTDPVGYLASHGVTIEKLVADITAEYNKMVGTSTQTPSILYRVRKSWADATSQIGAFGDLNNAKTTADSHPGYVVFDPNGHQVYPAVQAAPPTTQLYRVRKSWADAASQIGAFGDLNNAKASADANQGYAVYDGNGNEVYRPAAKQPAAPVIQPAPVQTPVQPVTDIVDHTGHHDILGKSVATAEQMTGFVKAINTNFDIEIAKAYLSVGDKYGIRGDIAFCQSIVETGYFKFDKGTAVTPDQHNYFGCGVLQLGMKGDSFETILIGVKAQIQHLYGYAVKEALDPTKVVDPRYKYLVSGNKLGIAPHWEDLNNKWAMNSQYGQEILAVYDKLIAFVPPVVEQPVEQPVQQVPTTPVINVVPTTPVAEEKVNVGLLNKLIQAIIDFLSKFFK